MRTLSSWIRLDVLPPGRRIFALQQMRKRAVDLGIEELVEPIDRAIAQDQSALAMDSSLHENRSGQPIDASSVDQQIDRTLTMIWRILGHYTRDYDDRLATKAQEFRELLFPQGLGGHIHLEFPDQLAANDRVIEILETDEYRQWFDEQGFRSFANRLRSLNASFGAFLTDSPMSGGGTGGEGGKVTWNDVKAARNLGQELLLQLVARVLGIYADDADTRNALLEPVVSQLRSMAQHRRRRQKIVDVDPDTGHPRRSEPQEFPE